LIRFVSLAALVLGGAALASVPAEVELTSIETGHPEPILADNWQANAADAAAPGLRACFHTPLSLALLTETFALYEVARPQPAPASLACYDAGQIGADLAAGTAVAFLSARNIAPGVDRVVAVYPDGRAYVWQQPNDTAGKN